MKNDFKPMLAPNEQPNLNTIQYPILASTKLDGIRCIFKDGLMLSRSLKPIRNKKLQQMFESLKELSKNGIIFDGELYNHKLTFQQITHLVMSEEIDETPDLKFWCFDIYDGKNPHKEFVERVKMYFELLENNPLCHCIEQIPLNGENEVNYMFDQSLDDDYEGLILKNPYGYYKFGRGTIKEGLIYKVKPFNTYDLKVIDVYERMENMGESKINELGYKQKERHKDNMELTGISAGFIVDWKGHQMKVTLTGDELFRKGVWDNKEKWIGKIIEVKGMEVGSKNTLRHPIFVRCREDKR